MSLRSRVIYWLRCELVPSSAPLVGRGHGDLTEGAGQQWAPVLVHYYATLEFPYGTSLDGVPNLEAIGQEVRLRSVLRG